MIQETQGHSIPSPNLLNSISTYIFLIVMPVQFDSHDILPVVILYQGVESTFLATAILLIFLKVQTIGMSFARGIDNVDHKVVSVFSLCS